jgi:hypothetical protein
VTLPTVQSQRTLPFSDAKHLLFDDLACKRVSDFHGVPYWGSHEFFPTVKAEDLLAVAVVGNLQLFDKRVEPRI